MAASSIREFFTACGRDHGGNLVQHSVSHSTDILGGVSPCLTVCKCSGNIFTDTVISTWWSCCHTPDLINKAGKLIPLVAAPTGRLARPHGGRAPHLHIPPRCLTWKVLHLMISWEVEAAGELIYPPCTHEEQSSCRTWLSSAGMPTYLQFSIHYILVAFTIRCLADVQLFCRAQEQTNMYIFPAH